jgi:hypothetical protein
VANGRLQRMLRQRRTALHALAAGVAVVAVTLLATLPSSATATPGSAIPASAVPALATSMVQLAQWNGDAHPASIQAVSTTEDQALQTVTPGDLVPGSAGVPVYLVVMTGNFTDMHASVPPGAAFPTGKYLAVTIDPATGAVMDLGLGNNQPPVPLSNYGPVTHLTSPQA